MKRVQHVPVSTATGGGRMSCSPCWGSCVPLRVRTSEGTYLCLLFEGVLTPFSFLFWLAKAGKFISHLGQSRNRQVYVTIGLVTGVDGWKDCDESRQNISELPNTGVCFEGFLDPNSMCCLLLSKAQPNLDMNISSVLQCSAVSSRRELWASGMYILLVRTRICCLRSHPLLSSPGLPASW